MDEIEFTSDHLLIIGNGFDLDLKLKTSYKDFLNSNHFKDISNNNLLKSHLSSKSSSNNWIDIEMELKTFSKKFKNIKYDHGYSQEIAFKDFSELKKGLNQYFENLDYSTLDTNSIAYKLVQESKHYLFEYITFNYTDSLEKILSIDVSRNIPSIHHIHGSAKDNNIILGVEDAADVLPEHRFFKKSLSPKYNSINLGEKLQEVKSIVFFGLTLGETDHTYFCDFFQQIVNNSDKYSIQFYDYGEYGLSKLNIQLDTLTGNNVMKSKHNNNYKFVDVQKGELNFELNFELNRIKL